LRHIVEKELEGSGTDAKTGNAWLALLDHAMTTLSLVVFCFSTLFYQLVESKEQDSTMIVWFYYVRIATIPQ
jgi:hypothetical protein